MYSEARVLTCVNKLLIIILSTEPRVIACRYLIQLSEC
jgi:hypothetical protein